MSEKDNPQNPGSVQSGSVVDKAINLVGSETPNDDGVGEDYQLHAEPTTPEGGDPRQLGQRTADQIEHDRSLKLDNDYKKSKYDYKIAKHNQDNGLRKTLGCAAMVFVAVQLVVSDSLVYLYVGFMLPTPQGIEPTIMITWMSASLVEVIGILWVVARNLFPFHDKHRDKELEKDFDRTTKLMAAANKH